MSFNKNKFFIALVCVAIGWGVGYQMGRSAAEKEFYQRMKQQGIHFNFPFGFFNFDPFESSIIDDPQHDQHRQKPSGDSWWKNFLKPFQLFQKDNAKNNSDSHSDSFSLGDGFNSGPELNTREDDKFIYYEFLLKNISKDSMSVKVENNMVILEGTEKKESLGAQISSSFYKSFPTPDNVDIDNVLMDYQDNKLIVKFPKIH